MVDPYSLGRLAKVKSDNICAKRHQEELSKKGAVRLCDGATEGTQSPQKQVSEMEHTKRKDSNGQTAKKENIGNRPLGTGWMQDNANMDNGPRKKAVK